MPLEQTPGGNQAIKHARLKSASRWLTMMAGVALAAWAVSRTGSFGMVEQRLRGVSVLTMAAPGLVLILAIGARAARFSELLGIRRTAPLWASTAGYSLACVLLPGGIGELTLPLYLKPHGVSVPRALTVAVIARLADVATSALLVLPALPALAGTARLLLFAAAAGMGILLCTRASVRTRLRLLIPLFWRRAEGFLAPVLSTVRSISWQKVLRLGFWTLIWKLLNAVMYWRFAQALHIGIRFIQVFNALILYSLWMILPLPSIAGFGTSEAGWILALKSQGTGLSQAVLAGLAFHVGNLLLLTLLGGLPMLRLLLRAEPNLVNQLKVRRWGRARQRKGDIS